MRQLTCFKASLGLRQVDYIKHTSELIEWKQMMYTEQNPSWEIGGRSCIYKVDRPLSWWHSQPLNPGLKQINLVHIP